MNRPILQGDYAAFPPDGLITGELRYVVVLVEAVNSTRRFGPRDVCRIRNRDGRRTNTNLRYLILATPTAAGMVYRWAADR